MQYVAQSGPGCSLSLNPVLLEGLASGYLHLPEETKMRFIKTPEVDRQVYKAVSSYVAVEVCLLRPSAKFFLSAAPSLISLEMLGAIVRTFLLQLPAKTGRAFCCLQLPAGRHSGVCGPFG